MKDLKNKTPSPHTTLGERAGVRGSTLGQGEDFWEKSVTLTPTLSLGGKGEGE
jgi:hypothetical protein